LYVTRCMVVCCMLHHPNFECCMSRCHRLLACDDPPVPPQTKALRPALPTRMPPGASSHVDGQGHVSRPRASWSVAVAAERLHLWKELGELCDSRPCGRRLGIRYAGLYAPAVPHQTEKLRVAPAQPTARDVARARGAAQSDRAREGHCRALPLASGQCSESKPPELGPESGPRWTRCDNREWLSRLGQQA
jgi:hypothetical protein